MTVGRRIRFGFGATIGLVSGIFFWVTHLSSWDYGPLAQIAPILVFPIVYGVFLMKPALISGAVFGLVAGIAIAYRYPCRFPCPDGDLSGKVIVVLVSVLVCGVFGFIWGIKDRHVSDTRIVNNA